MGKTESNYAHTANKAGRVERALPAGLGPYSHLLCEWVSSQD